MKTIQFIALIIWVNFWIHAFIDMAKGQEPLTLFSSTILICLTILIFTNNNKK